MWVGGNFNIKMEKSWLDRNKDSHTRERVVYFSVCVLACECEMQIQYKKHQTKQTVQVISNIFAFNIFILPLELQARFKTPAHLMA